MLRGSWPLGGASVLLVASDKNCEMGVRIRTLSTLDTQLRVVLINASHFYYYLAPLLNSLLVPLGSSSLSGPRVLNLRNEFLLFAQQAKCSL